MGHQQKRRLENRNANPGGERLADDAFGSASRFSARIFLPTPRPQKGASRRLGGCNVQTAKIESRGECRRAEKTLNRVGDSTTHPAPALEAAAVQADRARNNTALPANTRARFSARVAARNPGVGELVAPLGRLAVKAAIAASDGDGGWNGSSRASAKAFARTGRCRLEK